jgi:hypothetical protein
LSMAGSGSATARSFDVLDVLAAAEF